MQLFDTGKIEAIRCYLFGFPFFNHLEISFWTCTISTQMILLCKISEKIINISTSLPRKLWSYIVIMSLCKRSPPHFAWWIQKLTKYQRNRPFKTSPISNINHSVRLLSPSTTLARQIRPKQNKQAGISLCTSLCFVAATCPCQARRNRVVSRAKYVINVDKQQGNEMVPYLQIVFRILVFSDCAQKLWFLELRCGEENLLCSVSSKRSSFTHAFSCFCKYMRGVLALQAYSHLIGETMPHMYYLHRSRVQYYMCMNRLSERQSIPPQMIEDYWCCPKNSKKSNFQTNSEIYFKSIKIKR